MATKQRIPNPGDAIVGGISAFDDLADAIANPDPGRPLRDAIGQSGRQFCNFIGAVPQAARVALGPGINAGALVCQPYWDKNNFTPPVEGAPFTGGQCAESYQVMAGGTADVVLCSNGAVSATRSRAMGNIGGPRAGPISGVRLIPGIASTCGVQNYDIEIKGPNMATVVSAGFWSPGAGTNSQMVRPKMTVQVVPLDGTDTCGNPPSNFIPGPKPPPTPPAFPPGEGPGVDPDGQPFFFVPSIPPAVPGADPIDPPSIEPPPTGPGGGGDGGPTGGTEGPGGTAEHGDDAEGEADEGEELVALKIDIVQLAENAREIAPGLYRGVCYVFMGNSEGLDLDPAGAILGNGQLVLAERDRLTRWRVSANIGYILNVTPYYRTIEP